jgi:pimeloyl-ACP methyl ester carboxylesterase
MIEKKRRVRKMPIILIILAVLAVCAATLIGRYLYNNMNYDTTLMSKVEQAGFKDKHVTLDDGSVINYGEGPDNGSALLLIHGQSVAWRDYDTVLPELSKSFHVYAVDCYGHGASSHNAGLYSCEANGKALLWFMKNVIKENCYLSGHSSGGILAAWIAANAPAQVNGLLLEDPPLFSVTPEEVQEGKGATAWYETYIVTHDFVSQHNETDFPLYYLKHSYLFSLFGGLQEKIARSAEKYRQAHPGQPVKIAWLPHAWVRPLLYMDNYDPQFGNAFYDGSWMKGVVQDNMLESIECPVIYLKANTQYGKDGVLYAANSDEDADKVQHLIYNCKRINIKSGHDIHFDHPDVFISACKELINRN